MVGRFGLAALLAATAVAPFAQAQIYPARPLRMICPSPPGGSVDYLSRVFAQHLRRAFWRALIPACRWRVPAGCACWRHRRTAMGGTPEQADAFIRAEMARWPNLVTPAN